MHLVTPTTLRDLESRAFADGHSPASLMESAGRGAADAILQFHAAPACAHVFFGKGHNGGDALAAARHLAKAGWKIVLHPAFPQADWCPLTAEQHLLLPPAARTGSSSPERLPTVLVDGLLGLGARPPLHGPAADACRSLNALRLATGGSTFSLDLPSGLDPDSGEPDPDCVVADFTLTVGAPKSSLVADAATRVVGRIAVIPLPGLPEPPANDTLSVATSLHPLLPRRSFDCHKGDAGRVLIVAGSTGMAGAAVLAASGALRAGAGLVTLCVPPEIHASTAAAAPPEIMVRPVDSPVAALDLPCDAAAVGPGAGLRHSNALLRLAREWLVPAVIDADALNSVATHRTSLREARGPRLLTPHPGELRRLAGNPKGSRADWARAFVAEHPVTLLLKGARTVVAERGRPLAYNSTGHPGMATGGMGDLLTGVATAFLAQKIPPFDAARLAAWLCGRAAERAVAAGQSAESLAPSDLLAYFGLSFHDLRSSAF
jgi:NAD(P)H-hydrate epimerase